MFLQILTASGQLGLAKDSIQPSCNQLSGSNYCTLIHWLDPDRQSHCSTLLGVQKAGTASLGHTACCWTKSDLEQMIGHMKRAKILCLTFD